METTKKEFKGTNSTIKVFQRIYDAPNYPDGRQKENKFLGEFEVIEVLYEGFYSSQRIGKKDGKLFMITEEEVSGFYNPGKGGSRFDVKELDKSAISSALEG